MAEDSNIVYIVFAVAACFFATLLLARSKRQNTSIPPGPPSLPIVGSAFSIPKEQEWLTYERWSHDYGSDLLFYSSWGKSFVVINSLQAAVDLFERKSSLYADRPRMPMLTDLCGWGWDLAFMPYDDHWKLARKLFTQHFRQSASIAYRDEETRCARELLQDIVRDPSDFFYHTRLTFGKLIMSVTYGIDVQSSEDVYITNAQNALSSLNATGNVGTYLVDFIPLLRYIPEWFPGAQFQSDARRWRESTLAMAYKPFETVKSAMRDGSARPSVLSSLLDEYRDKMSKEIEYAIVSAAGTAYEAASETTWSATLSVILAMVLYPDVLAKAQAEIDRVVGMDRFPEFNDQENLPYVTAVCKEALRWRPGLPLAVMHRLMKDDSYRGYHIPGGSTVILNSWAILHDENTYPNPDTFSPERYLDANGELDPKGPEPTAAFGFGRRACAGTYMAQDTLWIVAAMLLWAFKIERATNEEGAPIEVSGEYTFGVVSFPTPFKCVLCPRTRGIQSLIMSEL